MSAEGGPDRLDERQLAQDRTDWAEDRTLLADERTFAGWMRTGLASCGVGLGFHAIFGKSEPVWLAKSGATLFVVVVLLIFFGARRSARRVHDRLDDHAADPVERGDLGRLAALFSLGALVLAILLWLLRRAVPTPARGSEAPYDVARARAYDVARARAPRPRSTVYAPLPTTIALPASVHASGRSPNTAAPSSIANTRRA